jgi:hypothetical protein
MYDVRHMARILKARIIVTTIVVIAVASIRLVLRRDICLFDRVLFLNRRVLVIGRRGRSYPENLQ